MTADPGLSPLQGFCRHNGRPDGQLMAEGVTLAAIAKSVGTPFYCYSSAVLEDRYLRFAQAFAPLDGRICYALKANANQAVITTLARFGAGADIVSGGELQRALAAGIPADRIVFSGVGKTRDEMTMALSAGIHQFNLESEPEMLALADVAQQVGVTAPVAVRINPDVASNTHDKIATGHGDTKFGIPWTRLEALADRIRSTPGLDLCGIAIHIGSQIHNLAPFATAYVRLADLVATLRAAGHAVSRLDLGGGFAVPYEGVTDLPTADDLAGVAQQHLAGLGCKITIEPGRALVAEAGALVTRVLYVKDTGAKRFTIVDGAMNDLIRPTLYGARHPCFVDHSPAIRGSRPAPAADTANIVCDVVGPVCETGDYLARDVSLPAHGAGDLLAVMSAGAYGAVMASTYNSRPMVPEVLVRGEDFAVVRPRGDIAAMIAAEPLPPWLSEDRTGR